MNKINNYNNYNMPFYGTQQKETALNNTSDNDIKALINKCVDVIKDSAERMVPENNKFRKFFVAFDVPDTRHEAIISISHDELDPKDKRRLAVEVHHANSDKFYSQYLFKGTKKEIIDFIADKNNQKEIYDSVKELSKSVDDDYR